MRVVTKVFFWKVAWYQGPNLSQGLGQNCLTQVLPQLPAFWYKMSGELTEVAKISVQHSWGGCGEAINILIYTEPKKIKKLQIATVPSQTSSLFHWNNVAARNRKHKSQRKIIVLILNYNLRLKASAINISERVAGVRAKNGQNWF